MTMKPNVEKTARLSMSCFVAGLTTSKPRMTRQCAPPALQSTNAGEMPSNSNGRFAQNRAASGENRAEVSDALNDGLSASNAVESRRGIGDPVE